MFSQFFLIISLLLASFVLSKYLYLRDSKLIFTDSNSNVFLIGGIFFFLFFISFYEDINILKIIFLFVFLIIGIADDKFNLRVSLRFFLSFFSIFILFFLDTNLIINFNFIDNNYLNMLFSIFILMGFMHMSNMSDGQNGLLVSYLFYIFVFIIFFLKLENINNYEIYLLFSLIIFLIFNILNITYLGNAGVLVISIITYFLMASYYSSNIINSIDIFCLFSFLFLDGLRVTLFRALKNKPIFKGDQSHIHYMFKNWKIGYFIFFTFFLLNLLTIYYFSNLDNYLRILASSSLYLILYCSSFILPSKKIL
ncbi:hypothetical protein OAB63_01985 [Alphaproteobacteria bacterium]|nr:hypothetical protein [Alphaproteobacteria bacterium]